MLTAAIRPLLIMKKSVKTLFSLSFGLLLISGHCVAENVATSEMIASVNGEAIAEAYYLKAIQRGISGKFYHGKIPDNELEQFKQGSLTSSSPTSCWNRKRYASG